MKQLLNQKEREKLQSKFQEHPLLLICYKTFSHRTPYLKSLAIKSEDIFCEVANMLDFLLYTEKKVDQQIIDNLWTLLINDIRDWKADAHDEDKLLVAGSVFMLVREVLCHHCNSFFSDDVCDMLSETLEKEYQNSNKEEEQKFQGNLLESSDKINEWLIGYEAKGIYLSEEIEKAIVEMNPQNQSKEEKKREIDKERLEEQFNVKFNKKDYIPTIINFLEQKQKDKNLARSALIIYESQYFIKKKYNTFSDWYKTFCEIVGCKFHSSYEPNKLKDSIYEKIKNQYWFL